METVLHRQEFCAVPKPENFLFPVQGLWQNTNKAELSFNRFGKSSTLRMLYPELPESELEDVRVPYISANPHTLESTYFDKGFINVKHSEVITFFHSKLSVLPGLKNKYIFYRQIDFLQWSCLIPSVPIISTLTVKILTIKSSSSRQHQYSTSPPTLRWCSKT